MVNYLNMFAHFTTLTQLRARIRSIPDVHWDGRKMAAVESTKWPLVILPCRIRLAWQ